MSVRKRQWRDPKTGQMHEAYIIDVVVTGRDGQRQRIREVSPLQTRRGAEQYERDRREEVYAGGRERKEVPRFGEFFKGQFWREWVVARKNKPSEVESKHGIYEFHLKVPFGELPLGEITMSRIAAFRANLVEKTSAKTKKPLSEKRINNILAVLSKALRYAAKLQLIDHVPEIGLFKVERPEIEFFEFEQYARVLEAAKAYGPEWCAAVCFAGEAGLRVGEVKAIRWREDVDLVARTVTVNQQIRHKAIGTPKGRTRRTIPMTATLYDALKALAVVRTGFVLKGEEGGPKTDEQARYALDSIYVKAGLPSKGWHILRHTFGTHSALLGVNPWRLQAWMGHKRIDETMLYVHVAEDHRRPIPALVLQAPGAETDPDRRILAMLGARLAVQPAQEPVHGHGTLEAHGNCDAATS